MNDVIMHYLNSFLSCSIRNLTVASFDVFPFSEGLIPTVVFLHESSY